MSIELDSRKLKVDSLIILISSYCCLKRSPLVTTKETTLKI